MKIVAVTGGIGVGKSTTAKILKKFGAYVIDADKIAKGVTQKGGKVLESIAQYFGKDILNLNGELDRKKLADIVFKDDDKLEILNNIIHPEVYKQINNEIEKLKNSDYNGLVIIDIPIPQDEFIQLCDEVWVIDSDLDKRVKRIIKRNGFSREEALKRIEAQMTREQYHNIADRLIMNNNGIHNLEEKIRDLVASIM